MTRLVFALAFVLFVVAHACAEPAPKPEIADEADVLRVQLAEARAESLAVKIEAAKRDLADLQKQAQDERAKLTAKYKLGDGDQIDAVTRAIKRAPKPPTKEPKK